MAKAWYERLTQADNSFLVLEGPTTHMHVAGLMIFDDGPVSKNGRVDIQAVRDQVASRLDLIPRYRQRLMFTPVEGHPVWVDDASFNIDYHVRHTCLPSPAGPRELRVLAARIMSQQLDRGKPLWENWVVERPGRPGFALVSKTHHCMIDGASGVDLMAVLMSLEADTPLGKPAPWTPRPIPSALQMAAGSVAHWAWTPIDVARSVVRNGSGILGNGLAMGRALGMTAANASATPVNRPVGPHRRFNYTTFRLSDVKRVKAVLGGTINDVVLATVSMAVRAYLKRHRVRLNGLDFRVMTPVSVRSEAERGKLGNRVSAWQIQLPVAEANPVRALELIAATTRGLKEKHEALGAQMLTQVTEWTGSTLLNIAARLAKRTLPFNTVVTNVPGPQVPLYLCGSKLLQTYPMVPLFVKQGFGVALFSYNGNLHWGVNADWDVMPDLDDFVAVLAESFKELCEIAGFEAEVPDSDSGDAGQMSAGASPPRTPGAVAAAGHIATDPSAT